MRRDYSVINDLYGVEAAHTPASQAGLGLVILMLLGGMFLYQSIHPVMRLRSEPPSAFLKGGANSNPAKSADQDSVARSYWDLAANFVSAKYSYGEFLPSNPPENFTAAMGGNYAASSRYWQRLRGLWNQPEIWVQSYQLDTGWVYSAIDSASDAVTNYLKG